jgi:hypothetical protein
VAPLYLGAFNEDKAFLAAAEFIEGSGESAARFFDGDRDTRGGCFDDTAAGADTVVAIVEKRDVIVCTSGAPSLFEFGVRRPQPAPKNETSHLLPPPFSSRALLPTIGTIVR